MLLFRQAGGRRMCEVTGDADAAGVQPRVHLNARGRSRAQPRRHLGCGRAPGRFRLRPSRLLPAQPDRQGKAPFTSRTLRVAALR